MSSVRMTLAHCPFSAAASAMSSSAWASSHIAGFVAKAIAAQVSGPMPAVAVGSISMEGLGGRDLLGSEKLKGPAWRASFRFPCQ